MRSCFERARVIAAVAVMLGVTVPSLADSIYLKNGRVIRVADARIDGDRVLFHLHGGEQAIPLALVERVEDDEWRGPGAPPPGGGRGEGVGATGGPASSAPSGATPPSVTDLGQMSPDARLDALSGLLGGDANQALGLLQALGGTQGGDGAGAGLESLLPLSGALGGGNVTGTPGGRRGSGATGGGDVSGALGGPGSLGADLEKAQAILPVLARLGAALFAPEYSAEATDAAARDLLRALSSIGVPEAEIRARARQLGVPEELLDRMGGR